MSRSFESTSPTTMVTNPDTRVEETPERPSVVTDLRNRINRAEAEEDDSKVVKLEGQLRGAEEEERLRVRNEKALAEMRADRATAVAQISDLRTRIARAEKEEDGAKVVELETALHQAEEDKTLLDQLLAEEDGKGAPEDKLEVTGEKKRSLGEIISDIESEIEAAEADVSSTREKIKRAEVEEDEDKVLKFEKQLREEEKHLAYEKARLGKYNELSDLESEIREQKEKVKAVENSNEEAYTEELVELRRLEEQKKTLQNSIDTDWSLGYADHQVVSKKRALDESLASKAAAFNANRNRLDAETTTRLAEAKRVEAEATRLRLEKDRLAREEANRQSAISQEAFRQMENSERVRQQGISESDEVLDADLNRARSEYAAALIAWKNANRERKGKLKSILSDLGLEKQVPETEWSRELVEAERAYIEAKKRKSKSVIENSTEVWEHEDGTDEYNFNPALINQAEAEYAVLQQQILDSMPPLERGIVGKCLDVWARVPSSGKIAISTALITALGLTVGTLGLAGAASYAGYRAARGGLGVLVGQGTGKFMDAHQRNVNARKVHDELGGYGTEIDMVNFEDKERELMRFFERQENVKKRQRLYKAGAMLATGIGTYGATGLAQGHFVPGLHTDAGIMSGAKRALGLSHDAVPDGPQINSGDVAPAPDGAGGNPEPIINPDINPAKVDAPTVFEKVTEAKVELSPKGFIQDIHNLKGEIIKQYGGDIDKVPQGVRDNFLNKPSAELAKQFHFFDPEHNASAVGLKGETLGINDNGDIVYHDLHGSNNVLFDARTNEVHQFAGKMSTPVGAVHDVVPDNSVASLDFSPDQVQEVSIPDQVEVDIPQDIPHDVGLKTDFPDSPEVVSVPSPDGLTIPPSPSHVPFNNSFVDVVESGNTKAVTFNAIEIGHEHGSGLNKLLVLDDKYQDGPQYAGYRGAFAKAFEANTQSTQLNIETVPTNFEGGKIYVATGFDNNPNAVKVLLNGKEIAKGFVTASGPKVDLLDDPSIARSSFWFGGKDTVFERAFKQIEPALKSLKVKK